MFINCPFDDKYLPLLRALLFTVIYCGLEPLLASIKSDSSEYRLDKIKEFIKDSDFSIHDISRMKAEKKGDVSRFNLPFELGLDFGCKCYCVGKSDKKILILTEDSHTYDQALSDISGNDIEYHSSDPETLVRKVRDWINNHKSCEKGGAYVWNRYNEFQAAFELACKEDGYDDRDIKKMKPKDYITYIKQYIEKTTI